MRPTPSPTAVLLTGCLALLCSTGCGHLTRPSPQHALLDESTIVDALDTSTEQGTLLLTEEGLWALLDPERFTPTPGGLLLLTQPDSPDAPPQLFAVAATYDWGAMLQRISRTPFIPSATYTLTPIAPESLTFAEHGARICLTEDDCNTDIYEGISYPLHGKDLLLKAAHGAREDHYTLPIKPTWQQKPGPRLIIPTDVGDEHGFIISIETRCAQDTITRLALPSSASIVSHAPPAIAIGTHPRRVEELAAMHHADVLVGCPTPTSIEVATPSLARPWLPARHAEPDSPGPALLGATPLTFDTTRTSLPHIGLIASGAGWASRGFFARAAVAFERVFEQDMFTRQRDAYALPLAQIIALDAPEQAARIAHQATRQAWRRDEVLAQNMVMIAVWTSLGQRTPVNRIEQSLPERTSRQSESELAGWTTWRGLVQEIRRGELRMLSEIKSASKSFPQQEQSTADWNLMLAMSLLLSDTPPRGERLTELENAIVVQASSLDANAWTDHYLRSDHGSWGCEGVAADATCVLDVSGKRLHAVLEREQRIDALLGVPVRPPYLVDHGSWGQGVEQPAHDPLIDMVMALIRAKDPIRSATQLAAYYGGQLHEKEAFELDQIERIERHITHRDRPVLSHIDTISALLDGLAVWLTAPEGVPAHELFVDHLGGVEAAQRGTIYTFWYHALLTDTTHPQLRARIEALRQNLPAEAPASMCTGIHNAHALGFLEDNRTGEALEALGEVKRCDLEDLDERARLDVELVRALVVRQHRGSLPGEASTAFARAVAQLDDGAPSNCGVAWSEVKPLERLLDEPMRALARRFAPVRDAALADGVKTSLVPLNATSKKALAQREMTQIHEMLARGKTSEAMAQLDRTLALAREARAWHLVRQLDFAREVLAPHVSADEPNGGDIMKKLETSRATKDPSRSPMTLAERERVELALAFLSEDEATQRATFGALQEPDMQSTWMKALCAP